MDLNSDTNHMLYYAFDGNQTDVEKLLKSRRDLLECRDHIGRTPLMHCAISDNVKTALYLLRKGARPTETDSLGATALHWAAICGSLKVSKAILQNGEPGECLVLIKDSESVTPLHVAATSGCSKILKLFEEYLEQFEAEKHNLMKIALDKRGRSPLHYAATRASLDCVKLLIDSEIIDLLVDQRDKNGLTPLMCAVGVVLPQAVAVCNALAIRKKVSMSARNRDGQTALHLAVAANNVAVVKLLVVDLGAQVDPMDNERRTPLHYAAEQGEVDIVKILLDHRASALTKDICSVVPAHYAAQVSKECLQMILANTDTRNVKDKESRTCLMWAVCAGNEDAVSFLLQTEVDRKEVDCLGFTALHLAAMTNNENMCKLLIRQGWNPSERDRQDNTPMHLAAGRGHVEVMRSLVTMNANLNDKDSVGRTPLFWACLGGQPHTVHVMIKELGFQWRTAEGGTNSKPIIDYLGRTPLHAAAFAGFSSCITILLNIERKDDCLKSPLIGWADQDGKTALHVASREGKFDCVQLLIREGAGINALDRHSRTPLEYATDPLIINYMKSKEALVGGEVRDLAARSIQTWWREKHTKS